jgi:hypothetical protein
VSAKEAFRVLYGANGSLSGDLGRKSVIDVVVESIIEDEKIDLGLNQFGSPIAVINRDGNPAVYGIGSQGFKRVIFDHARCGNAVVPRRSAEAIQQTIEDYAAVSGKVFNTAQRVAKVEDGCEIDSGDSEQTRFRITPGKVEVVTTGSTALFERSSMQLPFVEPAEKGNLTLLSNYLNFDDEQAWLCVVWVCYVLSTPRSSPASYPILLLVAEQGCAKSTTCKLVLRNLVDPSQMGLQGFPSNRQDMTLAANHAHALMYDNLRYLSKKWSDALCIACTGGTDPTRKLYTNGDMVNHPFKVPLVLNGLHNFIDEPDLAQRCVPLRLNRIPEGQRRTESELEEAFHRDLPKIFRGLLELISQIFEKLPNVQVKHPERMLDYVRYLAAVEEIRGMKDGYLQAAYSSLLNDAQRDSVLADPLAEMVYKFIMDGKEEQWSGTPTELLHTLGGGDSQFGHHNRDLPKTAISLSKKLGALAAGLRSQGVDIEFTRGKRRKITITNLEAF